MFEEYNLEHCFDLKYISKWGFQSKAQKNHFVFPNLSVNSS